MVRAGGHAHAALAALPRGEHHAGLAVGQVFQLEGPRPAGFLALAAAKALLSEIGQVVAVLQRRLHGGLELLGALVEQQAEIHAAVVVLPQAGQHLQKLLGAGLGALGQLLHHLPAGELFDVVGRVVLFIRQREPRLKHRGPEKFHQPRQLVAQVLGAHVVLALAAGGQVEHDLFAQGKVRQRLPREGGDAAADDGVLAVTLLAADPEGIVVGVGRGDVPLHLLGRGRDAAAAAGGNAQAAVGAGVPVLYEVGPGEDLVAVGADVLAQRAGGAVGVQVPALAAVHLRVGGLHQGVHRIPGKDAHGKITPFPRCPPGRSRWSLRHGPAKSAALFWRPAQRRRNPPSAPCEFRLPGCPAARTGGGTRR